MILFTKGTELTIFGQLKILMNFSINLNLNKLPSIWLATKNVLFSFTSDVYNNLNL